MNQPKLVGDEGLFRTLSNVEEVVVQKGSIDEVRDKAVAFLGSKFAAPKVTEQDGTVYLYAEKGAWSRFGVYVTHASILIIFIGAAIGNIWGYKGYVNIVEGGAVDQVFLRGQQEPHPLGFTVRCDDFQVSYYEGSRRPKEFASKLTVLENGDLVAFAVFGDDHDLVLNPADQRQRLAAAATRARACGRAAG